MTPKESFGLRHGNCVESKRPPGIFFFPLMKFGTFIGRKIGVIIRARPRADERVFETVSRKQRPNGFFYDEKTARTAISDNIFAFEMHARQSRPDTRDLNYLYPVMAFSFHRNIACTEHIRVHCTTCIS